MVLMATEPDVWLTNRSRRAADSLAVPYSHES